LPRTCVSGPKGLSPVISRNNFSFFPSGSSVAACRQASSAAGIRIEGPPIRTLRR
jgi:hypothetical protein